MKKILTLILVAALVFTMSPVIGISADSHIASAQTVHKISTASQFHNISKYNGGSFKITKNIRLKKKSQYLTLKKNYTYKINLNGKKITTTTQRQMAIKGRAPISMYRGTLQISDSSKAKTGVLYTYEGAAVDMVGGKIIMKSGSLESDFVYTGQGWGFGIHAANSAKVHLYGGMIKGRFSGVALNNNARIYTYGTAKKWPFIWGVECAGLLMIGTGNKASFKGGTFATSSYSGFYPISDQNNSALPTALKSGYYYWDSYTGAVVYPTQFLTSGHVDATWDPNAGWKRIVVTAY